MNNGHPAADGIAQMKVIPVNQAVIQCLTEALERARRGEFTSMVLVGSRAADMASFDSIVIDNIVNGMMVLGAMQVAQSKLTNAFREAQQQTNPSRIMRVQPGMPGI